MTYKNKKGEQQQELVTTIPYTQTKSNNGKFVGIVIIEDLNGNFKKGYAYNENGETRRIYLEKTQIFRKINNFKSFFCYEDAIWGQNYWPDGTSEPYIISSQTYCFDNDGVSEEEDGPDTTDNDGGGGGSTSGGDYIPPTDPGEAAENALDTDCESFLFKKTSIANWQEAGLNKISLRMVWISGNGIIYRNMQVDHIVFGLPTYYTNPNGTTTPLSAGGAANISAQAVEFARNMTYAEFRNSPYYPNEATIKTYFKTQVNIYMLGYMGTAGATGSGSSSIVFNNEIRSHYTNPTDC